VALKQLKSRPVSLQAFAPEVSNETAYVINRMMAKNPDKTLGQLGISSKNLAQNKFGYTGSVAQMKGLTAASYKGLMDKAMNRKAGGAPVGGTSTAPAQAAAAKGFGTASASAPASRSVASPGSRPGASAPAAPAVGDRWGKNLGVELSDTPMAGSLSQSPAAQQGVSVGINVGAKLARGQTVTSDSMIGRMAGLPAGMSISKTKDGRVSVGIKGNSALGKSIGGAFGKIGDAMSKW
jgi:hypothetical protein